MARSGDLIDQILTVGSTPDWISPLSGIVKDILGGPDVIHLHIHRDSCGHSVNYMKGLFGSLVWGDYIAGENMTFSCKSKDKKVIEHILHGQNIFTYFFA